MKYKFIWWDRYQTHIISTPVLWAIPLILNRYNNTDNNFHLRWRIASIFKGRFHKKIIRKSVVIHQTGGRTFHITWSSLKWSLKDGTKKDVLKSDKKYKKPYLHSPGIDMVFWRKKFCDPMSDVLFTLLGQTWCLKWSLMDWTKKYIKKWQ